MGISVQDIQDSLIIDDTYDIIGQKDAKIALEDNLRLRAVKDQGQKIILLEGPTGTGKSTLTESIINHFKNKYPDRFEHVSLGISDLTAHVGTTSTKIDEAWDKLKKSGKSTILLIDEADEVLMTRRTVGNIRNERTTSIILKLNKNIPNLLIILITNRPKMIDAAILDRCEERINCDFPTEHELRLIIDMHMKCLVNDEVRDILHRYMIKSSYKFNGRDILGLSNKLKTKLELKALDNKEIEITARDISLVFEQLERSKRKLKADYLDDGSDNNA